MSPWDFWSRRLLDAAGVFYPSTLRPGELEEKMRIVERTRAWVWGHARPRQMMGAFRYEGREADGKSYDQKARKGSAKTYTARMRDKIEEYDATGNQEMLVDIYNYVLLEVLWPTHPTPHFKSTERHE